MAGQFVNTEHSGGLNVKEWWAYMLRENEVSFQKKDYAAVLTDSELTEQAYKAFPDRTESAIFRDVKKIRNAINRGICSNGIPPVIQSTRYDRLADGRLVRVTARNRILWVQEDVPARNLGSSTVSEVEHVKVRKQKR